MQPPTTRWANNTATHSIPSQRDHRALTPVGMCHIHRSLVDATTAPTSRRSARRKLCDQRTPRRDAGAAATARGHTQGEGGHRWRPIPCHQLAQTPQRPAGARDSDPAYSPPPRCRGTPHHHLCGARTALLTPYAQCRPPLHAEARDADCVKQLDHDPPMVVTTQRHDHRDRGTPTANRTPHSHSRPGPRASTSTTKCPCTAIQLAPRPPLGAPRRAEARNTESVGDWATTHQPR